MAYKWCISGDMLLDPDLKITQEQKVSEEKVDSKSSDGLKTVKDFSFNQVKN